MIKKSFCEFCKEEIITVKAPDGNFVSLDPKPVKAWMKIRGKYQQVQVNFDHYLTCSEVTRREGDL